MTQNRSCLSFETPISFSRQNGREQIINKFCLSGCASQKGDQLGGASFVSLVGIEDEGIERYGDEPLVE
jgi:hypothetical protein